MTSVVTPSLDVNKPEDVVNVAIGQVPRINQEDVSYVLERAEEARRIRLDDHALAIHYYQAHWAEMTKLRPPCSFVTEVAILREKPGSDGPKVRTYGDLAAYIASSVHPRFCVGLGIGDPGVRGSNYIEEIHMVIDRCIMYAIATDPFLRKDIPAAEEAYYANRRIRPEYYARNGVIVGGDVVNAFGTTIVHVELHLFPDFLNRQGKLAESAGGLARRKGAINITRLVSQPGVPQRMVKEYNTIAWGMLDEEGHPWTPRA